MSRWPFRRSKPREPEIVYPPENGNAENAGYYWLHAERSGAPAIAQWMNGRWFCIGEHESISFDEMRRRGWEVLGPAIRPPSHYIDG